MASPYKRYIAAGNAESWIGFYDANGLFCGSAPTLAEGDSAGMLRVPAVKEMSFEIPERERQNQSGDDQLQGFFTFESIEATSTNMLVGVNDLDFQVAVQDVNLINVGPLTVAPIRPSLDELPPVCLLNFSQAKKRVFGQQSAKGWEVVFLNQGEINPIGEDNRNERTIRNWNYQGTWENTLAWPWGMAMTKATENYTQATGGRGIAVNPVMFHAFRANGTATTFTLAFKPAGDHSSGKIAVFVTDLTTLVTTVVAPTTGFTAVASTGVITLVGTAPSNKHYTVVYERAA
ncbi:MAG: hypothetical protein SF029_24655 [bacterium]|nr:hypothetical protein [bacterium]